MLLSSVHHSDVNAAFLMLDCCIGCGMIEQESWPLVIFVLSLAFEFSGVTLTKLSKRLRPSFCSSHETVRDVAKRW